MTQPAWEKKFDKMFTGLLLLPLRRSDTLEVHNELVSHLVKAFIAETIEAERQEARIRLLKASKH